VEKHKDLKMYKTLDNYSIGFVVFVGKEKIYIYGRTKDVISNVDLLDNIIIFEERICCSMK
jgi:Neuraminidase (sialidase)